MTIGKITDIQWDEVFQQHQIKLYEWSVNLGVSVGHLNMDKVPCYPIWYEYTYGRTTMITYDNEGEIYLNKIDGE